MKIARAAIKGGKLPKERLSVLLCASILGEKLKPLVIGKSAYPNAFRKNKIKVENLPITWRSNKAAWMTADIFKEWLAATNKIMVRQNRKILLFLDHAPSHKNLEFSNIVLQFSPPNMTSMALPLDQGAIYTFKLKYRKLLLESCLSQIEQFATAKEFYNSVTVLDAIRWMHTSWAEISEYSIKKCFQHSGFIIENEIEDDLQEQEDKNIIRALISNQFGE